LAVFNISLASISIGRATLSDMAEFHFSNDN